MYKSNGVNVKIRLQLISQLSIHNSNSNFNKNV